MQSWNWNDQASQAQAAAAASYAAGQNYSSVPVIPNMVQAQMGYQQYYGATVPGNTTAELTQQQLEAQQQQQWQWNTWHQSFQQWQKEYGGQYQAAINPMSSHGMMAPMGMSIPMLPDMARPPPVPPPEKPPPPPPDELPESFAGQKRRPEENSDPSKKPRNDAYQNARGAGNIPQKAGRWGPSVAGEGETNSDPALGNDQAKDEPSEQEKAFDVRFQQWEKQFSEWKAENINHPDKTQYQEYEAKWMGWREKLLQRRVDMKQKREKSSQAKTPVQPPLPSSMPQATRAPGAEAQRSATAGGIDGWPNRPAGFQQGNADALHKQTQNKPAGPEMPPGPPPSFLNQASGKPPPTLPANAGNAASPIKSLMDIPLGFLADKANAFLRGDQPAPATPQWQRGGPASSNPVPPQPGNFAAVRNQGAASSQSPNNASAEQKGGGPPRNQPGRHPGLQKQDGGNVLNFPKAIQLSQNTCKAIKGSQQSEGVVFGPQPENAGGNAQAPPVAAVVDLEEEEKQPINYDFLKKSTDGIPGLDFAASEQAGPGTPNSSSQNDSLKFGQDSSTSQDMVASFAPKIHTSQGQGFQFPKAPPPPPPLPEEAAASRDQGGDSQDAEQGVAGQFGGNATFGSFGPAIAAATAAEESQFYADDFDFDSAPAPAGHDFQGPAGHPFSFGMPNLNPRLLAPNQGQNFGPMAQPGMFGANGQGATNSGRNLGQNFGPMGQPGMFGVNSQSIPNSGRNLGQNFGPMAQLGMFGVSSQASNNSGRNQGQNFGPMTQSGMFAANNQAIPNSGRNQGQNFGPMGQPGNFGVNSQASSNPGRNQDQNFGVTSQPGAFGPPTPPTNFGAGNPPGSFGLGSRNPPAGRSQDATFGPKNASGAFGPNSQPGAFGSVNKTPPGNLPSPAQNRNMPGVGQNFGPSHDKLLSFGRGQTSQFGGPQDTQRMGARTGGPDSSWDQGPHRDNAQFENSDLQGDEDEDFGPEDYDEEWVRMNSEDADDQPGSQPGSRDDFDNAPPGNANAGPRSSFRDGFDKGRAGFQGGVSGAARDQESFPSGRPGFPANADAAFPQAGPRGDFPQGPRTDFPQGGPRGPQGERGGAFGHGGRGDFPQSGGESFPQGRDNFQQGGRDGFPPGRDGFPHGPRDNAAQRGFPQGGSEHGSRDEYPGGRDDFLDSFGRYDRPDYDDEPRGRDYGQPRGFDQPPPGRAGFDRPFDRWNSQEGFYRNEQMGAREDEMHRAPRPWEESTFELEPATIVEYGHKPAGPTIEPVAALPAAPKFLTPVQTFDYGHGGSSGASHPVHPAHPVHNPLHFTPVSSHFGPISTHLTPGLARHRGPSPAPADSYRRDEHYGHRDREREFHAARWERERTSRREDDEDRYRSYRDDRPSRRLEPDWDRDRDRDSRNRDAKRDDSGRSKGMAAPPPPSVIGRRDNSGPKREPKPPTQPPVNIDDLISAPGRKTRPPKIVIILRGPPGSGKSFAAKLIKEKEMENGGSAPRILCLDDYFITEVEVEKTDPETGRKRKVKEMGYEYEAAMEKHYRSSLLKTFRKTVSENYFSFIIVDCVNQEVKHFEEMWSHAKQKGFQVYICEMDADVPSCFKRNVHNRTEPEITEIVKNWEEAPSTYLKLDLRSLLQSAAITEVEMEDAPDEEEEKEAGEEKEASETKEDEETETISKWEIMEQPSGDKLDRMDGLKRRKAEEPKTLEDWLTPAEDYDKRESLPGKKRVRWADLEEKRSQEKMRAIGFVVGQTDWSRMTDPTYGESALTQTKYI